MPKRENTPNHYLDCEVYGLAIAYHRRVLQLKPPEHAPEPAPPVRPPEYGKRPMGWNLSMPRRR